MARISQISISASVKRSERFQTGGGGVEVTVQLAEGETLNEISDKLGSIMVMVQRQANDLAENALDEALTRSNVEETEKKRGYRK